MSDNEQTVNKENIEKAEQWITSEEGTQYLHQLAENVESIGRTLIEESQIDITSLRTPVTF